MIRCRSCARLCASRSGGTSAARRRGNRHLPPDAIYEDVSRQLATSLTEALRREEVSSVRVDEAELPPEGCRLGPCLGVVARARGAQALVTLDAEELTGGRVRVVVTLMRATNGEPLAGGRYELVPGSRRAPRGLLRFLTQVKKATQGLKN